MFHIYMILLILALILLSTNSASSSHSSHYRYDSCHEKKLGNSTLAFQANLNDTLLNHLLPKASEGIFYNYTKGIGEDQVYALFFCKGDVDTETCQDCIQAATSKLTDVCKFQKEGIVWFEECTLRYSNRTIFSIDVEVPNYLYRNSTGIVNEPLLDPYRAKFESTMAALIQNVAYSNGTFRGFGTKEFELLSGEVIRGFAQCTPDILGVQCYNCLSTALRIRDTWANTIVFLPSCLFRYDLYGTAPPSFSPPPSQGSVSVRIIIPIVVVSVIFIILVVIGSYWLRKRCLQEKDPGPNSPIVIEEPPLPVPAVGRKVHGFRKYTFPQLEKMTNGFKKQIGKGAYGVVYHGLSLDGSREVAVKMLNENHAPKQFSNEIDVFGRISHKNLVSLLGYCEDGTKLGLIYEFMAKGDLRSHLAENASSFSWKKRLEIAIGTAEGLHYLHNHCEELLVHRDVKPDNILLTGEGELLQAKVADFGLCKIFPAADVTTIETRVIGTHGYTAPEYHSTGLLNDKADVYSFGVVLLELITGKTPRIGFNLVADFQKMFNAADIENILDPRVTRDLNYNSVWGATELAMLCVHPVENNRPTMWDIVVKLKECLDMEIKRSTGTSSTAPTSMEMMTAITSNSAITMAPEAR